MPCKNGKAVLQPATSLSGAPFARASAAPGGQSPESASASPNTSLGSDFGKIALHDAAPTPRAPVAHILQRKDDTTTPLSQDQLDDPVFALSAEDRAQIREYVNQGSLGMLAIDELCQAISIAALQSLANASSAVQ